MFGQTYRVCNTVLFNINPIKLIQGTYDSNSFSDLDLTMLHPETEKNNMNSVKLVWTVVPTVLMIRQLFNCHMFAKKMLFRCTVQNEINTQNDHKQKIQSQ